MKYFKTYSPRSFGFNPRTLYYDLFNNLCGDGHYPRLFDTIPGGEPMSILDEDGSTNWIAIADDWSFAIDLDTGVKYRYPMITQIRKDALSKGILSVMYKYDGIEVIFKDQSAMLYQTDWEIEG